MQYPKAKRSVLQGGMRKGDDLPRNKGTNLTAEPTNLSKLHM